MASHGRRTYRCSIGSPIATPPARTLIITVTRPNGSVQDSRSATLAEVIQSAVQSAQSAA
jgi:hypothetical protein